MNKNGQVLVTFIVLLPLILMVLAIIVDTSVMISTKIKGEGLLKTALKNEYNIDDYFKVNDIDVKSIKFNDKNNKSCVIIEYTVESVFGGLIGYNEYNIKLDSCGE